MKDLVAELGATAQSGDCVVTTVPLKLQNDMPVKKLAGKIVLDTNNYIPWRDDSYPLIDSGEKTEPELRQEQLPTSKVAKAFTHIQAPRLFISASPEGTPERHALSVSSNHPEAVELIRRFYNQLGFDTVENSPLSGASRSAPGQPAWHVHEQQSKEELADNLKKARKFLRLETGRKNDYFHLSYAEA